MRGIDTLHDTERLGSFLGLKSERNELQCLLRRVVARVIRSLDLSPHIKRTGVWRRGMKDTFSLLKATDGQNRPGPLKGRPRTVWQNSKDAQHRESSHYQSSQTKK